MADRQRPTSQASRFPLVDATSQAVNTSRPSTSKSSRAYDHGVNPLRAHPTNAHSHRPSSSVSHVTNRQPVMREDSNPCVSHVRQEDYEEDKRNSQFSTSSAASASKRKTHIGPWQLGKTLGKGSAARVRLARHYVTHQYSAVKIISRNLTAVTQPGSMAELDKWDRARDEFASEHYMPISIEREVAILKVTTHPNIVKLYDIWENRSEIYLVLQYVEQGDLFEYINRMGRLSETETMAYFRQILSALEYMHSLNICHRDLKPENILLTQDGRAMVTDFGMSALQQGPNHWLKTSCGSPHYAAPELSSAGGYYRGNRVDIWSLGVVLYACLCGTLPFDDPDIGRLMAKTRKGLFTIPDFLSIEARHLISQMLQTDPDKRITIRKIWQHPLLRKYDYLDDLNDGVEPQENIRRNAQCKPVPSEDVDLQILRQLKSVWHTFTERQLSSKLSSPEPNDFKLFYWLLSNYREERLENYGDELTHSPSDFHHLRPANWKKKYTTLEFPAQYGRTASRFTVISNVATDANGDAMETNSVDGRATVESYDPYKASRVMDDDVVASHANIIVHRKVSSSKGSTRTSKLPSIRSGSIRSSSTYSRPVKGGRHITTSAALRGSRRSLSSIRSGEEPYKRPASRHKRGVDFSNVRKRVNGPQRESGHHGPASIAGDDTTYDRDRTSPTSPMKRSKLSKNSGRARSGTQSMADVSRSKHNGMVWNEELQQFSHSIAKDCDDAFNSSLLSPQSYTSDTPFEPSISEDAKTLSIAMTTPTPAAQRAKPTNLDLRLWDNRPLPPAPSPTDSILREIMTAKKNIEQYRNISDDAPEYLDRVVSHLNRLPQPGKSSEKVEADRRVVSAPIYSQFSTQWGKDKIPLPSINETPKEDDYYGDRDKHRVVSAPAKSYIGHPTPTRERRGLEFLSQQEKTIRVVNSPSDHPNGVTVPAPLNIRKKSVLGSPGYAQPRQELNIRQKYLHDGMEDTIPEEPSMLSQDSSFAGLKKKTSWFKRSSKEKDDIFTSKAASSLNNTDQWTRTDTNSSDGPANQPGKKKSFGFAFWRGNKEQQQQQQHHHQHQHQRKPPPPQLSLAGPDFEDSPSPKAARMFSHPSRPPYNKKWNDKALASPARNIEPQQSWLARLFRVKPATRHLCFTISRRRVRQEIAFLLKEWRPHGIRDIVVDKERNLVFARVAKKNHLHLKESAFAAEIMTVIEHGRRNQLSIVRFTQERGAASTFNKVLDTMNEVFSARGLLIVDKNKAKMMIRTLNS
ncbi:hypothetical protein F5B20DRAFT_589687 [Whalleya microplaca]|nr:hypothetical protein F5B20DRAFT_589687 [Whalleya microplaca]